MALTTDNIRNVLLGLDESGGFLRDRCRISFSEQGGSVMARSTPNQYPVVLSDEQRQKFLDITRNGHAPAKKIRHAQLLLLSDHDREGGPLTRTQIAEVLQMHPNTVDKIRKKFVRAGEAPALNRKRRETPPTPPISDGHSEAQLVAICCSDPPEGRVGWTMQLLADELLKRRIVTTVSAETVRRVLKNELKPWQKKCWCIPERDRARFVAPMEDVLDAYAEAPVEDEPLICMDEASKQLLDDELPPMAMIPGHPLREDYHYQRHGTQALFMFFNPHSGWRRVSCRDSRPRIDWAEEIRQLLLVDYPQTKKAKLVCDTLNTHSIASLYEAFTAPETHALKQRLELHFTPRNGSWLRLFK